MGKMRERMAAFLNNRWLVFVAAMWLQSVAGIGYLFGSLSPVIKASLGYNQRQLARIGVAKDLGDSVGSLAGVLCEILPLWAALLIGAVANFVGYGCVWLVVTGRLPTLPLWAMCILIFVGTNGETFFNTSALVSCVQNFPKSRGPIVGILKGFAGLSGAILTQIFALIHTPDKSALLFMVATGPSMVAITLMFLIRPVRGPRQVRKSDQSNFLYIYSICLLLAAYLMGVMIVQDLVDLNHNLEIIITVILFVLLLAPLAIPIITTFYLDIISPLEEPLTSPTSSPTRGESSSTQKQKQVEESEDEVLLSEIEEEKAQEEARLQLLQPSERKKRIAQLKAKFTYAAAKGGVRVKKRGPHRGEDFTLVQAVVKADFWLIFVTLLLGAGSGLTVIDNLGQMSQSLGFDDAKVFVSMISIWNFLGRVAGGYFSEIIVRDYAYPRPIATAVAQLLLAVGHFLFATAWPGTMYIGTLLVGLGYGAHWAVIPATASELFGLKNFGSIYNFLTIANPVGSMIFSGVITSSLYDYEAEKQAHVHRIRKSVFVFDGDVLKCVGPTCFFASSLIMMSVCIVAACLSLVLVRRTRRVYSSIYGRGQR
ncbi:Major facilitator superfamily protein [Rhynchospora pubera]|uniref:Major facilitator superfamily protein n=1 Tax=Rhynchospora pubera TaxID=906938 RepID=A0AAV8D155_9POAL|nr:Major facilitator superfamily protein [Rhynchospora pubera]